MTKKFVTDHTKLKTYKKENKKTNKQACKQAVCGSVRSSVPLSYLQLVQLINDIVAPSGPKTETQIWYGGRYNIELMREARRTFIESIESVE